MLAELAAAVRDRRVSAVELVRMSLERIERHDPQLNAVVAPRAEGAMADAAALDDRVAHGDDPGPLVGLPVLVKDCEDVAGMRTTYGSLLHADDPPAAADGPTPGRLRAAGAVVVGKANLPEFAAEGYTANRLFGTTRNPWGPEWSPGGSSGGSGAALSAGMVPIATATDWGGSIRIPAAFCGLVGLKPTNGIIGRVPNPAAPWDLSTDGPLGTSVGDLRLLLSVQAGPALGDPTTLPRWAPSGGEVRRVLAAPRLVAWGPLPDPIRERFDVAVARVERDLGLPVEPIEPEMLFRTGNLDEDWFTIVAVELAHALGRRRFEREADRLDPGFRKLAKAGLSTSVDEYVTARRRRLAYARELDELLGGDAVLVTPTLCLEGWYADGTVPRTDRPPGHDAYNTNAQNMCGNPALSVPAGLSANGIPFSITFTGPRFRDDMVLAVGAVWEAANPWSPTAPGYEPFAV